MTTIQVDSDVLTDLQIHAQGLIDRIRAISSLAHHKQKDDDIEELLAESLALHRKRAPKADLLALVTAGLLRDDESLFLIDYQGNRVAHVEARVAGSQLAIGSRRMSMSALASEGLKRVGFRGSEVRGPTHWVTAKGDSVADLWQKLLARRTTRAPANR